MIIKTFLAEIVALGHHKFSENSIFSLSTIKLRQVLSFDALRNQYFRNVFSDTTNFITGRTKEVTFTLSFKSHYVHIHIYFYDNPQNSPPVGHFGYLYSETASNYSCSVHRAVSCFIVNFTVFWIEIKSYILYSRLRKFVFI